MIKKIKMLAASLLLACLFLPLSTCTTQPHPQDKVQTAEVFERYAVMTDKGSEKFSMLQRYGAGLVFILPFLLSLAALFRNGDKIVYALFDMFLGLAVIFVITLHGMTGQLVLGGYIAAFSGSLYWLLALLLLGLSIKQCLSPTVNIEGQ
ncbi:MAG: hypothetical protein HRU20_29060 [Pseudomonadales bacterium]|nr:hypothetical protein [Pseudomonadales bacterium]